MIPTRDRWPLLARALSSVLQQDGVELEVVVVDEGSSDGTCERVSAFPDDRVNYLRHERPSGVARARNRGISVARGEWIAFLDDDDLWAPTKLRSQLALCTEEGADFSYTGLVTTDRYLGWRKVSPPPPQNSLESELLGMNVVGPPSCVVARRALLEEAGGFDPDYAILADWDMWLRLATAGHGAACEAPLTAYTTHAYNMHLDVDRALEEFRRLSEKHAELAASMDRRLGNERWWGWIASALRRSGHRYRAAALFLWLGLRFRKPRAIVRAGGVLVGRDLSNRAQRSIGSTGADTDAQPSADARWLDAFVEPCLSESGPT